MHGEAKETSPASRHAPSASSSGPETAAVAKASPISPPQDLLDRRGEFLLADGREVGGGHAVLPVEHEGHRHDGGRVLLADGQKGLAGRVVDRRVGQALRADEVAGGVVSGGLADVDAEELHALVLRGEERALELRGFDAARRAPAAPDVDDDDLARVVGELQRGVRIGHAAPGQVLDGAALPGLVELPDLAAGGDHAALAGLVGELDAAGRAEGDRAGDQEGGGAAGERHAPRTSGSAAPAGSEYTRSTSSSPS